jgi:hypothetical protein
MISKTVASLAFAAACLTAVAAAPGARAQDQLVTNGPQVSPGDNSTSWSARQNVIESRRYDRLLETSPAFRQARIRKECGPITDAQLHASCLASFNQNEPVSYGSSTPPYRYRSGAGR